MPISSAHGHILLHTCEALLQVEAASVEVQDLQQQCAALESALKQTSTPPLSRRKV